MNYLRWIVNNKTVQAWVQARVSTKIWTVLTALVVSLGLTTTPVIEMVQETTTEGVTATIMENGGGVIKSLWTQPEDEIVTGFVELDNEVEVLSNDNYEYVLPDNAPTWNDVKGNGIYKRERDQEHGTCVFETFDIMTIEALKLQGLNPVRDGHETFIDINHGYLNKRYQPGVDSGSVPTWVFNQYKDEGLPIRTTYQDEDHENWTFEEMKAQADEDAYNYKMRAPYELIASGYGPDTLMRDMDRFKAEGRDIVFRISKRNHQNVAWFHETTPYIKDPVPNKSGGGHAMAGSAVYGVFEYKGEPTIFIHESAGSVRYHLARKSVLEMVMTTWAIYEVTGETEPVIETITVEDNDLLKTETIRKFERSEAVRQLQVYLIDQGYTIPAGATWYFGNQTQNALNGWQDDQFGDIYNGSTWGPASRVQYNLLLLSR